MLPRVWVDLDFFPGVLADSVALTTIIVSQAALLCTGGFDGSSVLGGFFIAPRHSPLAAFAIPV